MIEIEGLDPQVAMPSSDVASAIVQFFADARDGLDEVGFSNFGKRNGRTEYYLHYDPLPNVDPSEPEWEAARLANQKTVSVRGGRIFFSREAGNPTYASFHGEFKHEQVSTVYPATVSTAADAWYSRFFMPTPTDNRPRRVIMDTWHFPMLKYWRTVESTGSIDDDASFENYERWRKSFMSKDPRGIPVHAFGVRHDIFGGEGLADKDALRRLVWSAQHIGKLVANVRKPRSAFVANMA